MPVFWQWVAGFWQWVAGFLIFQSGNWLPVYLEHPAIFFGDYASRPKRFHVVTDGTLRTPSLLGNDALRNPCPTAFVRMLGDNNGDQLRGRRTYGSLDDRADVAIAHHPRPAVDRLREA